MKYLSTFTGIGGFELGINKAYEELQNISNSKELKYETTDSTELGQRRLDYNSKRKRLGNPECIGYSEINKYADQIYQSKFPEHKNYGDITKINEKELPDFDLLVGGFPCQAFSIAGKRGGFDDTRGTLFFDCARILKEKQPRNFILENVKGLLSHDNGRTFKTIINTLTELGYCVEWQVLNAKNFGVPQNRERVFIVGHLGGIPERKVFPITENRGANFEGVSIIDGYNRKRSKEIGTVRQNMLNGGSLIANTLDANYHKGNSATKDRHTPRTQIQEGIRIRRLTPLECERLMGYPDGWTEKGLSDTMEICVNINPAVENKLLTLDTVSSITSDGGGMVFPNSQSDKKESVNIVLQELLQEDGAINTINLGNAIATLFNRKGILRNATELKKNLTYGKMVEKSTYRLWKIQLVGHYNEEKLSTILTWINETMQLITSISARTDLNIIGCIIHFNKLEQNYSSWESLNLKMGNIVEISDTQRYKTLGNGIVSNVVAEVVKRLYLKD